MIDAAIQKILTDAGHNAFNHVSIDPDKDLPMPARPFVVHGEQINDTIRCKSEILGYVYEVVINVVHNGTEQLSTLKNSIADLLESQQGTIQGTTIERVTYLGNDGVQQDEARAPYYDTLRFTVETINK